MKMSRRYLKMVVVISILVLVFGCAFLQTVRGVFCNPTEAQKQTAAMAAEFAKTALALLANTVVPGAGAILDRLIDAQVVFDRVRNGACVTLDELDKAINTVETTPLAAMTKDARLKRLLKPDLTNLKAVLKK